MGCWSYQVLCDDSALDAQYDFLQSEDLAQSLQDAFDEVLNCEGNPEYDACQYAIVAAAVVDSIFNGVDAKLLNDSDVVEDMIELSSMLCEAEAMHLVDNAISALDVVLSDESELNELWADNNEMYPQWVKNINTIKERLASI